MSVEPIFVNVGAGRLELIVGDITQIPVDAIVNAANSALAGGGGVDGAIHRAGGPSLMQELGEIRKRAGGCATGSAIATGAGRLPAKFVFHAVGPVYRDGRHGEPDLLRSCYWTCLDLADQRSLTSISFPSISTGAYGYPVGEAAEIAVRTVRDWLETNGETPMVVKLVQFSKRDHDIYRRLV
jgi:O-acetyl-ADP-ribose deacetylase (regulator of RNase III)